jgi:hypothetical protein
MRALGVRTALATTCAVVVLASAPSAHATTPATLYAGAGQADITPQQTGYYPGG